MQCDKEHEFFCILALSQEKNHVWTLKKFNVIFGPFARHIAYGAEVTQLDVIGYGAEVHAALTQPDVVAPTWHRARRHRSGIELGCVNTKLV
jgi:hypothetical protein